MSTIDLKRQSKRETPTVPHFIAGRGIAVHKRSAPNREAEPAAQQGASCACGCCAEPAGNAGRLLRHPRFRPDRELPLLAAERVALRQVGVDAHGCPPDDATLPGAEREADPGVPL